MANDLVKMVVVFALEYPKVQLELMNIILNNFNVDRYSPHVLAAFAPWDAFLRHFSSLIYVKWKIR